MITRKTLFAVSSFYVAMIVAVLILMFTIIPSFKDVGHLKSGCYFRDAMIIYVECRGFFGYQVVKFIVNLPFQLIYWPLFGVVSFFYMPWLILWAAAAWAPIIYFCWYLLRERGKD